MKTKAMDVNAMTNSRANMSSTNTQCPNDGNDNASSGNWNWHHKERNSHHDETTKVYKGNNPDIDAVISLKHESIE